MKLSIIIPVYNVEQYLEQCLNSCLNQDFPNTDYEIIAINDGSMDGSLAILHRYSSQYPHIHVLSQSNKKQGAARNYGLSIAKGEYIWFVDSDDWIESNCLKQIFEKQSDPDILLFPGFYYMYEDKKKYQSFVRPTYDSIKDHFIRVTPPGYLFKRLFLEKNKLYYIENLVFEDNEFIPKTFYHAKSIGYIEHIVYYCRVRNNSTTHSVNFSNCSDLYAVALDILKYEKQIPDSEEWHDFFNKYVVSVLNSYFFYTIKFPKREKNSLLEKVKKNKNLQLEYLQSKRLGSIIKMNLLNNSIPLFCFLLRVEDIYRRFLNNLFSK